MGKLDPLALAEISAFISLGMPIMTISTLIFLMNFVDIAMMGHYSKDGLAAVGIGAAWFMITYLPINGALFALDPVLSQAFGANDTQSYRTWFKSGTITISLLLPVTLLMLWFTKDILSAFSLDPELVAQTAVYTRFLLPGVPFVFGFQLMTKYFQCQHILAPAVWIALTANIANVILDYVFIFSLDQGVRGAAIATSLSRVFLFMGSIFCLALRPAYRTCFPSWADTPSLAQFQTIGRLALGGAGMVIVEVSSFEITTMLAAQLGQLALDSHVVAFNLFTLIFFVTSFPFGVAASIRVGNLIGSQQPLAALLSAKVAMVCVLACSCVMAVSPPQQKSLVYFVGNSIDQTAFLSFSNGLSNFEVGHVPLPECVAAHLHERP
eukprot:c20111_g1_i6.p1 GENE.c20111_g1_i6~~c20111_g1_i6.p1  ORF type:complete len:381 (-),score=69.39 c20111_g1_i6:379-1521(-)